MHNAFIQYKWPLGSSKMGNQVVRLGSKQELSANGANISDHCVVIGSNHPRGSEQKDYIQ